MRLFSVNLPISFWEINRLIMYRDSVYDEILQKVNEEVTQYERKLEIDPTDAATAYRLSLIYKDGLGVTKDYEKAYQLVLQSYDTDQNPLAANVLGTMYYNGMYVEKNQEQGLQLMQYAHQQGNIAATFNIGIHLLVNADSDTAQEAQGLEMVRTAAEKGNHFAQFAYGGFYDDGRMGQDYTIAFEWYQRAADSGSSGAAANLGFMYRNGVIEVDDADDKALEYFRKSAYMHNAHGMYNLGSMYDNGISVEENQAVAFYWFTKAASKGSANATYALYRYYSEGIYTASGVTAAQRDLGNILSDEDSEYLDYEKAAYWFEQAAEEDDLISINNLGWMYENGFGVEQDYATALNYFYKAAEAGYAVAQCNVGRYYIEQRGGMPKDIEHAKQWLQLSADQGYERAVQLLEELRDKPPSGDSGFWKKLFS